MGIEVSDADKFEQQQPVDYDEIEELEGFDQSGDLPLDADPLDAADQRRPVPLDDDLRD